MYFIAAWLAIWLSGVPVRNLAGLQELVGIQLTLLIMVIAVVAAIILAVKFLQCERAYTDLALGIVSMQLGYLLTRYLWLVVTANELIDYRWQYFFLVGMNLYYMVYLMRPSTQIKIAQIRASLLAERQRRRQAH